MIYRGKNYIFLIWWHQEDGPEGLLASSDLDSIIFEASKHDQYKEDMESSNLKLEDFHDLINNINEEDMIIKLGTGWGGTNIQIVELN